MNSPHDNGCSQPSGSPIRTSPDHRLLASPRGLSQLATSFIAYLRQGIHTHALSSLTIKSISNTKYSMSILALLPLRRQKHHLREAANTCSKYCPSNIRLSKIRLLRYCWPKTPNISFPPYSDTLEHSPSVSSFRLQKHGGPG